MAVQDEHVIDAIGNIFCSNLPMMDRLYLHLLAIRVCSSFRNSGRTAGDELNRHDNCCCFAKKSCHLLCSSPVIENGG
ncbi:hypothetical protein [Desulfosediminicola sp.]|uniref:hypothetical protein n=1 Tax=Desulfosediminicola sp. TaxID=2886825 RepID=UPI003AF2D42F